VVAPNERKSSEEMKETNSGQPSLDGLGPQRTHSDRRCGHAVGPLSCQLIHMADPQGSVPVF